MQTTKEVTVTTCDCCQSETESATNTGINGKRYDLCQDCYANFEKTVLFLIKVCGIDASLFKLEA